MEACRCGHNGNGPHPCHAKLYTCKKPAKRRLIPTPDSSLAGKNPKTSAYETWACDECWANYQLEMNELARRRKYMRSETCEHVT